ncbi:MAG: 16S rRNA (guanine(966)-N(2))-methyltransferase RsmD [Lachnospiraceae bacterium]
MRVIAGTARSLPLVTPQGKDTRPTTDRIKETLFNIIQGQVGDSVFFDFFSGSGGIGIEALSRGAKKAYFVENDKNALNCIRQNLAFTKFTEKAVVMNRDVRDAIPLILEKADIIFMDPPYSAEIESDIMQLLLKSDCLKEDTVIIIEADKRRDFSFATAIGFRIIKEKQYKTNKHVFLSLDV